MKDANGRENYLKDTQGALKDVAQGDRSTWFGVYRQEWSDQVKLHPDKYPNINPFTFYAKTRLNDEFAKVVRANNPNKQIQSLPAYAKVLDWISNNEMKGLLLMGDCGTGKTAIMKALYQMFAKGDAMWFSNRDQVFRAEPKFFKSYSATDLHDHDTLDEALQYRFVMIDDIGTEDQTAMHYGKKRHPIAEIVDNAEKKNSLLILSSNLTPDDLSERYGERTTDRLNVLCKIIRFEGNSFR